MSRSVILLVILAAFGLGMVTAHTQLRARVEAYRHQLWSEQTNNLMLQDQIDEMENTEYGPAPSGR